MSPKQLQHGSFTSMLFHDWILKKNIPWEKKYVFILCNTRYAYPLIIKKHIPLKRMPIPKFPPRPPKNKQLTTNDNQTNGVYIQKKPLMKLFSTFTITPVESTFSCQPTRPHLSHLLVSICTECLGLGKMEYIHIYLDLYIYICMYQ